MIKETFSQYGKMEAIASLYEGTAYKAFEDAKMEIASKGYVFSASKLMSEGIDFDLVYYPLKHLGYKAVVSVTGELYASMAHPEVLSINLGVSNKLDYSEIKELWSGVVAAAKEHKYKKVLLDLIPSLNGLTISLAASGQASLLTIKRMPKPKTKDLICVSGNLGAAYMGLSLLEEEKKKFEKGQEIDIEEYKLLVGAYLMPEISPSVVSLLEDDEIYPSSGYLVNKGLSDAIKRLSRDCGLGAKIYADKIPFAGNTFQLGKKMNIDPISAVMNGGEDYRLLFTVPILEMEKFRRDFQTFDIIGHLALPEVGTILVTPDGVELPLTAQGWD